MSESLWAWFWAAPDVTATVSLSHNGQRLELGTVWGARKALEVRIVGRVTTWFAAHEYASCAAFIESETSEANREALLAE